MAESHGLQTHSQAPQRAREETDAMTRTLTRLAPATDAEAFTVLRRAFPGSALCERVAAIGRWRSG
ncbi:MAG: hypothetical protein ACK4M0_03485 [Phreatobacter sp.]